MKKTSIYLTKKDVQDLEHSKIAAGSEGTIYRIQKGVLYKIYHNYSDEIFLKNSPVYDEDGVNIADYKRKNQIVRKDNILRYIDQEGIRLTREEALYKAIERQKDIHQTFLPENVIYVNGRVKGCVLHEHAHALKIHRIETFPLRYRLSILKELLNKERELIEHNIYHIDLAQRPTNELPNTNVLFQFPNVPQIIDLDGHSAIYTEFFSDKALKRTEDSFAMLVMEILTQMNLETYLDNMDISGLFSPVELENILIEDIWRASKNLLDPEMIRSFLHHELSLDKIEFYLHRLSRKKL